uniref:RCC1-like domain-containing protein n=1 Tax=Vannella robusta TaxID=1487602 RepID=A0A7S4HU11_9EUKA|mmetsp:Transcript_15744/g.20040  ORF Transcript_15744/g.20040 Transcript_15744/m.20040 type:complete len:415 (+) Transcript_15744:182-1426(+)
MLRRLLLPIHSRVVFQCSLRSSFSDALKRYNEGKVNHSFGVWGAGDNKFNQICVPAEESVLPFPVQDLDKNDNIVQVHTCHTHSLGVTENGKLWIWGSSRFPGVVLNDGESKPVSPAVFAEEKIIHVQAGREFNVLVAEDKQGLQKVYTCGSHELGQCGIGGKTGAGCHVSFPHTVGTFHASNDNYVTQIAAGFEHCLALTSNGEVFSWGNGVEGQLGHGDPDERAIPKRIEGLPPDIMSIAAGVDTSAAITLNGELYLWGSNEYQQLGVGSKEEVEIIPKQVKALEGVRIKSVHLGGMHTIAMDKEQNIYGWGCNISGQLGLNQQTEFPSPQLIPSLQDKKISQISCSLYHTACVSDLGVAYTFGQGQEGQLGHEEKGDEYLPRSVDMLKGKFVKSVACGMHHTLFLVEKTAT